MALTELQKYRAFRNIVSNRIRGASPSSVPPTVSPDLSTTQEGEKSASGAHSVQKRFTQESSGNYLWWAMNNFAQAADSMPSIGTKARDAQLRLLWPTEPILAGTIYTLESKMVTLGWTISGKFGVDHYTRVLQAAENGAGWGQFISRATEDYLTSDNGMFIELGHTPGSTDVSGLFNLDAMRCLRTGDPDYPVEYTNSDGEIIRLPADSVITYASMPSPAEERLGSGLCFVSRALSSAKLLIALHKYEEDRLRNMPPRGIATVTGMTMTQVKEAMELYEARQASKDMTFPGILWLTGNPFAQGQPVGVNITQFGGLPEGFNRQEVMETYAKTLALNAGCDVGEIWLVQHTGATKATGEIQEAKARGKGFGEIITLFERIVNWNVLPEGLEFLFDMQNDEADMYAIQLKTAGISALNAMYAIPNGFEPIISKKQWVELAIADGILPEDFEPEKVEVPGAAPPGPEAGGMSGMEAAPPTSPQGETPQVGGQSAGPMKAPEKDTGSDTSPVDSGGPPTGQKDLTDELKRWPKWKKELYAKRVAAFRRHQGATVSRKADGFLKDKEPESVKERGWFADNPDNPHVAGAAGSGSSNKTEAAEREVTRPQPMVKAESFWAPESLMKKSTDKVTDVLGSLESEYGSRSACKSIIVTDAYAEADNGSFNHLTGEITIGLHRSWDIVEADAKYVASRDAKEWAFEQSKDVADALKRGLISQAEHDEAIAHVAVQYERHRILAEGLAAPGRDDLWQQHSSYAFDNPVEGCVRHEYGHAVFRQALSETGGKERLCTFALMNKVESPTARGRDSLHEMAAECFALYSTPRTRAYLTDSQRAFVEEMLK